ncbi:hypothetical protein M5K25_020378 [Dendrobium thyrsiflorum]|uniref:Pentatricopeptide repeat-containing protein n=1 Tax=Dendrobium thyrsiflorum TaxID=117978 RepID=A0ABD0U9U7_DENTH
MELQNTPFTVQLGRGASIQLANAVINTGDSEATIRFGSLEFSAATAKAAAVPIHGITVQGHSARSISTEIHARRVNSVQQPRAARTATAKAVQQNRTSVFERLSHPEVSTVKKTDIKQKTLPILSSVITLPTEPFVPGRHDHEASSSGGRLSRRQRRKLNAKLRAQQPLPVHPSTLPALEPEANVPTQNKFANLKWVKRNSSAGELKQSFWEQQQQATAPQKKKYETLSARVHRVLKVAKENGLIKKKYQRPFINKTARIPSRELPAARVTQEKLKSTPRGEHWSMKPELRIQESADKRSRWKGKEIWRPRLPKRKLLEKNVRIGVTSGIASQRSASKKNRQQWVPKEKVPMTNAYNGRHLGESSKESYCQPTSSYQKEINVDRTLSIEEVSVPHPEPEIYWKRHSEIRVQENDEEEDTMEVEVVYMVGHGDEPHQTRGYKRRNEPGPTSSKTITSQEDQIQYEQLEGEEVPSGDDQNDDQEEEVLAETLAQAQRRLKFQMKEKDKEISELNSKMTEMMAQMTVMMQLMQKNIITNPALVQPADHQSSIPTNLPTNPVPQELLDRVAKFEKLNLSKSEYHSDRPRRNKTVDTRRDEESVKVITSSPILPINEEDKIKGKMMSGKDEWQTVISKKTMKMIKQLEGVPGIKWKSSTEPVLELKENPNSGTSTSRSLTWRRFKTKRFYKTSSKKSGSSNKHSKLKEKRTVLQKIINNLEDYRQPVRRPITLADFMSELQIDLSEVEEDEQDDEELLHVETCRVISVTSTVCQRDSIKDHDRGQIVISPIKMTNKMTSESCLMVLQTDDNSEEELCFPSDDESDQRIVSQMERVKLNEDSEHTTKTSSDEAESNEVDQVQLRSEEDDDISETYKPLIKEKQKENTFVVTLIPPQHFREMVSREVHNVEELKIFYVPPLRGSSGPESVFYKSGEYEEENIDELKNFNEDTEILPTEMLRYCPKRIQQMIRKAGVHTMQRSGIRPDVVSYTLLISAYGKARREDEALAVFEELLNAGVRPTRKAYNVLLDAFAISGMLQEAKTVFKSMRRDKVSPDLCSYATMISAYVNASDMDGAEKFFRRLKEDGLKPNVIVYGTLMKGYAKTNNIERVMRVYERMRMQGVESNQAIYTIIMDSYGKNSDFESAVIWFKEMRTRGLSPDQKAKNILLSMAKTPEEQEEANELVMTSKSNEVDDSNGAETIGDHSSFDENEAKVHHFERRAIDYLYIGDNSDDDDEMEDEGSDFISSEEEKEELSLAKKLFDSESGY